MDSDQDRLQDFARTGFPGYSRVRVAERRRNQGVLWTLLALVTLGAVVIAALELRRRGSGEVDIATPPSQETEAVEDSAEIDPEIWRSELRDFEALLFAAPDDAGPMADLGRRFADVASPWAERLRMDGGARESTLADGLDDLMNRALRSDLNIRRLQEIRRQWLALRGSLVGEADWLQEDGTAASVAEEFDIYRQAAERISSLVSGALEESESLGDLGATEATREWRQVIFYLGDDLKVLRASLPRRPPISASGEMLETLSQLDRAFDRAQRLVQGQGDLSALDRAAFESAIEAADDAADAFDRRLADL